MNADHVGDAAAPLAHSLTAAAITLWGLTLADLDHVVSIVAGSLAAVASCFAIFFYIRKLRN